MTKLTVALAIKDRLATVTLSVGQHCKQVSHPAPGIALIRALTALKKPCVITAAGETNRFLNQPATKQDFARLIAASGSILANEVAGSASSWDGSKAV